MAQYINKAALVAELERRVTEGEKVVKELPSSAIMGLIQAYKNTLSFLDTLEVKEVDLDFQRFAKEMDSIFALPSSETKNTEEEPLNWEYAIAKHFFELGMCAANPLTVKDIKKIYHLVNEVSDDLGVRAMYVNIYKETLKRFKAQKGE